MESIDFRFPQGMTHLLVGPSGSGKTFRACEILKEKNKIIKGGESIQNIVFCYAAWQPLYDQLKKQNIVSRWVNKMPSNEEFIEIVNPFRDSGGSIVVIDDFMREIGKELDEIVRVTSRHYSVSTFILFQSLFPPHQFARQISLNVKFLHIHKNPRENAQIAFLARQIEPQSYKWIVEAFHKATEIPYSAFLIDLTQERCNIHRFRSNYMPHEFPMKLWIKKGSQPLFKITK